MAAAKPAAAPAPINPLAPDVLADVVMDADVEVVAVGGGGAPEPTP